ncbi:MAG: carboxypeptidase-like regulatory domain-containing protein [Dehalococcoidia bacterium]
MAALRRLALPLIGLAILLSAAPALLAQGTGVVSGRVTNGSLAGAPAAGLTVTLMPVTAAGPGQRQTATSGPDGSFRFEGLATDASQYFVVWAELEGARFQQGPLQFDPGQNTLEVNVAVFATTDRDPGIRMERNIVVVLPDPAKRQLTVLTLADVENPSNVAYIGREVGQQRQTLRFGLPAGSRSLQVIEGIQVNALVQTADGFADTLPVEPGQRSIVFQYLVDYESNGLLFTLPVSYPTNEFSILLAEGDWSLTADGLQPGGLVEQGGRRFQSYRASNLAPGQEIRAVIQGQGLTSQALSNQTAVSVAIGGGILVVTIAAIAIPLARRRRRPTPVRTPSPRASAVTSAVPTAPAVGVRPPEPRDEERDSLLAALADLDDRHDAGELSDEDWQRLRTAKKSALVELIRDVRGI